MILKLKGRYVQSSRELAQASRNHEVPWINNNAQPSRVFFKKAVSIRAKIKKRVLRAKNIII